MALAFIFLLAQVSLAEEALLPLRVIRWTRCNGCVGEVLTDGESHRVRVRLAGVMPIMGNDRIYDRALELVRELTREKEVRFDFALGHGPEEKIWVGYLYVPSPEEGEELLLVNAEILREGLATLDEEDVGRNLLGYFIEAQEEAQEKKVGIWAVSPVRPKRKSSECPSCEIR